MSRTYVCLWLLVIALSFFVISLVTIITKAHKIVEPKTIKFPASIWIIPGLITIIIPMNPKTKEIIL